MRNQATAGETSLVEASLDKKTRENYGMIDGDDNLVRLGKGYHRPVISRGRTNWKDMWAMPPSSWSNLVEMYMVRIE